MAMSKGKRMASIAEAMTPCQGTERQIGFCSELSVPMHQCGAYCASCQQRYVFEANFNTMIILIKFFIINLARLLLM